MFSLYIIDKAEPLSNDYTIFALGPLIVVLAIEFGFDLWTTVDEVCCPVLANGRRVALSKEKISHFLHISRPGRKST